MWPKTEKKKQYIEKYHLHKVHCNNDKSIHNNSSVDQEKQMNIIMFQMLRCISYSYGNFLKVNITRWTRIENTG